jgi:hypothetical protein
MRFVLPQNLKIILTVLILVLKKSLLQFALASASRKSSGERFIF